MNSSQYCTTELSLKLRVINTIIITSRCVETRTKSLLYMVNCRYSTYFLIYISRISILNFTNCKSHNDIFRSCSVSNLHAKSFECHLLLGIKSILLGDLLWEQQFSNMFSTFIYLFNAIPYFCYREPNGAWLQLLSSGLRSRKPYKTAMVSRYANNVLYPL